MKLRIRNAYTLAEVLVALAVTGVIAAMTIPQVAVNVQKHRNAAVVGRTVQIIETGCQKLIQDANANSTNGTIITTFNNNDILTLLPRKNGTAYEMVRDLFRAYGSYFGVSDIAVPQNYSMNEYDGTESVYKGETTVTEGRGVSIPNVSFTVNESTGAYIGSSNISNQNIPYLIFIDANGQDKPNRFGKDIFMFGLEDSCKMIPAGSQKMVDEANGRTISDEEIEFMQNSLKALIQMAKNPHLQNLEEIYAQIDNLENELRMANEKIAQSKPFNSLDTETCTDGNITKGLTCTARVVKDGFKIKY